MENAAEHDDSGEEGGGMHLYSGCKERDKQRVAVWVKDIESSSGHSLIVEYMTWYLWSPTQVINPSFPKPSDFGSSTKISKFLIYTYANIINHSVFGGCGASSVIYGKYVQCYFLDLTLNLTCMPQ